MRHKLRFFSAILTLALAGCATLQQNTIPPDIPLSEKHPWEGQIIYFSTSDLMKRFNFIEWTQHPGNFFADKMPYEVLAGRKAVIEGEVELGPYEDYMKCRLLDTNEPVYYRDAEKGTIFHSYWPDGIIPYSDITDAIQLIGKSIWLNRCKNLSSVLEGSEQGIPVENLEEVLVSTIAIKSEVYLKVKKQDGQEGLISYVPPKQENVAPDRC